MSFSEFQRYNVPVNGKFSPGVTIAVNATLELMPYLHDQMLAECLLMGPLDLPLDPDFVLEDPSRDLDVRQFYPLVHVSFTDHSNGFPAIRMNVRPEHDRNVIQRWVRDYDVTWEPNKHWIAPWGTEYRGRVVVLGDKLYDAIRNWAPQPELICPHVGLDASAYGAGGSMYGARSAPLAVSAGSRAIAPINRVINTPSTVSATNRTIAPINRVINTANTDYGNVVWARYNGVKYSINVDEVDEYEVRAALAEQLDEPSLLLEFSLQPGTAYTQHNPLEVHYDAG